MPVTEMESEAPNGTSNNLNSSVRAKRVSSACLPHTTGSEFFWGCTLTKDKPEFKYSFEEEEDDDTDYLVHTLFLRHAVLGKDVAENVRQILEIETKDFSGEIIKHPIASLKLGSNEMSLLDINFSSSTPVTFRLLEGEGPLHITAQELVEFPPENLDRTEAEFTEDENIVEESPVTVLGKRKATTTKAVKAKRSKVSGKITEEDDDDDDEEEEDIGDEDSDRSEEESEDSDEEEEEESEEESPVKPKKGSKKSKKTEVKVKSKSKAVKKKAVAEKTEKKKSKKSK